MYRHSAKDFTYVTSNLILTQPCKLGIGSPYFVDEEIEV